MRALQSIRTIVRAAQGTLTTALDEASPELVNQPQPGAANSIGAIFTHAAFNLDTFYSVGLLGGDYLLTTGGFAKLLELPAPDALDWAALRAAHWNVEALHAYAQAVLAVADAYLDQLTEAELSRKVTLFGHEMAVDDVLGLAARHSAQHAGEISALRGVSAPPAAPA